LERKIKIIIKIFILIEFKKYRNNFIIIFVETISLNSVVYVVESYKKEILIPSRYMYVEYNQDSLNQTLLSSFNGARSNQVAVATTTSKLARK